MTDGRDRRRPETFTRRQFFDYFRHRLTKSSEVRFSKARLMRLDELESYDRDTVGGFVVAWAEGETYLWKKPSLWVRRPASEERRRFPLDELDEKILSEVDAMKTIEDIYLGLNDSTRFQEVLSRLRRLAEAKVVVLRQQEES